MKICTWNINSVRLRLPLLHKLVQEEQPDVICLQEIKVVNELFPADDIAALGFQHQHIAGMKGYNGVAILSRTSLKNMHVHNWCGQMDCRHISAELVNGITVHNIYVPAGGYEADPIGNPKFAHKLKFVEEQGDWWAAQKNKKTIVVGDLNIAPLEHDVWSHTQMLDVVSHTPDEVERFTAWQQRAGFVDVMRNFIPAEKKLYTWWSYRAADWEASDRGRRLDHIWATPDISGNFNMLKVLKPARNWPQPSDHVPVIAEMAV